MARDLFEENGITPGGGRDLFADAGIGAKPKKDNRTFSETAQDYGASLNKGIGSTVELVGTGYGLLTGKMDNAVRNKGAEFVKRNEAVMSPFKKQQDADRDARLQKIEADDGKVSAFLASAKETLTDPASLIEQAPQLLVGGGAGKAAKLGIGKLAGAAAGTKAGIGAAVGTNAVLEGADPAGGAYNRLLRLPDEQWQKNTDYQAALAENGGDAAAAKADVALSLSRKVGAANAALSLATSYIPGARAIDKALVGGSTGVGGVLRGGATGFLGEAAQETAQEGIGAFSSNYAAQQVDPNQALDEGVAIAAGAGAGVGGALGGVAGGLNAFARQPGAVTPEDQTISGLLTSPVNTGTPSDQVLAADVERANAVSAAQTNADALYKSRNEYEQRLTPEEVASGQQPTINVPTDVFSPDEVSAFKQEQSANQTALARDLEIRRTMDTEAKAQLGTGALGRAAAAGIDSGAIIAEQVLSTQGASNDRNTQTVLDNNSVGPNRPIENVGKTNTRRENEGIQSTSRSVGFNNDKGINGTPATETGVSNDTTQPNITGLPQESGRGQRNFGGQGASDVLAIPDTSGVEAAARGRLAGVQADLHAGTGNGGADAVTPKLGPSAADIAAASRAPLAGGKPLSISGNKSQIDNKTAATPVTTPPVDSLSAAPDNKPVPIARVGTSPLPKNSEPITIRDGVVFMGEFAVLDAETAKEITVGENADFAQIKKALQDGKALSSKQRVYPGVFGSKAKQDQSVDTISSGTTSATEIAVSTVDDKPTVTTKLPSKLKAMIDARLENKEIRGLLPEFSKLSGWSERGGNILRDANTGEVTGRTKWIPRADWWISKPGSVTEKLIRSGVPKALNTQPITKPEREAVEWLLSVVEADIKEMNREAVAVANEIADDIDNIPFDALGETDARKQMEALGFLDGEINEILETDNRKTEKTAAGPAQESNQPSDETQATEAGEVDRRHDPARRKSIADMTPEEMRRELLIDAMTGLGNRRAYEESDKLATQVSIDADGLKWVNDNLGHDSGDRLLEIIGKAIAEETANGFHISGDEYVIQTHTKDEANAIMARVVERLNDVTITTEGDVITMRGIGISYGVNGDLKNAEKALREHKAQRERDGLRGGRGAIPPNAIIGKQSNQDNQDNAPAQEEAARPELNLAGQTQAEIAATEARDKKAAEKSARDDAKPTGPDVTADQVDLFATQDSLLNSNQDEVKETPATLPKAKVSQPDTEAERADIAVAAIEQADAIEPAQSAFEVEPVTKFQTAQAKAQEDKIGDFGRKVIVRKDEAQPLGKRMKKEADERPAWARPYRAMQIEQVSTRDITPNIGRWRIMKESGGMRGSMQTVGRNTFATEQEALDAIPVAEMGRNHRVYAYDGKETTVAELATEIAKGSDATKQYGIYRMLAEGKKRALVKGGFTSNVAAMEYMATNPVEIIEHKFTFPERPWLDKIERTGKNRRTQDVTEAMFKETFAPGGVVYGNWLLNDDGKTVNADGQALSNHAYDGLMDLADTLGIPPKALFLNGDMVLGLGADGKGGKNSAAAHYSPGKVLINLTKINGAGSLAHEWWHSVDHYFARNGGHKDSASVVAGGYSYKSEARPELMTAIKHVVDTMMYAEKSKTTDADIVRKNAQKRLDDSIKSFDYHLNDLRNPYNPKKSFTPGQIKQWDALVAKLRNGEQGEQVFIENPSKARGAMGYMIGANLRDLNAIYKSVTGRSFLRADPDSKGRKMYWIVEAIKDNKAKLDISEDVTTTYKGRTEFYLEAREIDGFRSSDYWSTPEELGARAFESYIFDKLTAGQNRSDYLVYAVENRYYAGMDMKPYPEGDERKAINSAFDGLFATIDTKETDTGTAMFQPESAYDPYQTIETRDGTTPAQLAVGRAALNDAEKRILGQNAEGFALLGSNISADFRANGGTSLIGKEVTRPEDLAFAAQVLRDPRFETFRVFYTNAAGKIVGERAYSSRLAGAVYLPENHAAQIHIDMRVHGAAGYWLMHNHPSGSAEESKADLNLTASIAKSTPGFKGHVVIDHNEYNHISVENGIAVPNLVQASKLASIDLNANPEVAHPLLGEKVNGPSGLAVIAKLLQTKDGYAVLIGTNAQQQISLITEVPASYLKGIKGNKLKGLRAVAAIKRATGETGSTNLFAAVPGDVFDYGALLDSGILRDVVSMNGGESAAKQGLLEWKGVPVSNVARSGGKGYVAASARKYENPLREVDVFGNGRRVDYYDDKKGLMYSRQVFPTGIEKWTVFESFPKSEGGDQVLGEMFKYRSMEEAQAAVRGLKISATHRDKQSAKYGAIPSLWTGEAKAAAKAIIDAGIGIDRFASSTQSKSKYIYLDSGLKVRIADHRLPGAYDAADVDYRYGGDVKALAEEVKKAELNAATSISSSDKPGTPTSGMQERPAVRADNTGSLVEPTQKGEASGKGNIAQKQTETEAFKKWFVESKAIDADGNPLVVYHGTSTPSFTTFKRQRGGWSGGMGIWFGSHPDIANEFAKTRFADQGAAVYPVFLNIKKPMQYDGWAEFTASARATGKTEIGDMQRSLRNNLIRKGYDGIVIRGSDTDNGGTRDDWVAFEPGQIKSAIGNNGQFNPSNPSIVEQPATPYRDTVNKLRSTFGKPQTGPASAYAEQNRRIREEHIKVWDKAKKWMKRQLSPGGLLPDKVFAQKIERDSEFGAIELDVTHMVGALERAIKADYKLSANDIGEKTERLLSEVMAGKLGQDVPEKTKTALLGMRHYIDGMTVEYLNVLEAQKQDLLAAASNGSPEAVREAAERASLMDTIASNVGRYVHRSYRAFDDKAWAKKVPDAVLDTARKYLMERYAGEANAANRVEVILNEILKHGTAYENMEAFVKESKLGAKDLSVLKKREDIAPEIRALLGEYTDPRINFAKSATKMGRLIWNQRFLDRVRELGMGEFLFTDDTKPPEATVQIAGEKSDVYAPLNGLWVTPDVAQAFKDALGKEQMEDWYRTIVQINGVVKYGKTVLSPTTAARNWMSSFFFTVANGHFDMRHMRKSVAGFQEYFGNRSDVEKLAYLRELKQLGVVYDTPYAGEMMRLLADSEMADTLIYGKGKMKLKNALGYATKFYQYGDDFWKIIGYENEKQMFMDAGLSEQAAKVKAAERIRNTYPTYSMIGKGIQSLRRFPLAGTFVSFPAEIIRTSFNMVRYLAEDYKDPKMRPRAMKRAVGLAIVSSFAYALQAASMAMLGYDDDDEEAIRQMAAPWQQNSNLLFTGRDEKGNLRFIDLSFLDPYNYWKRPIIAVTRGQPWREALKDVAGGALLPFFGVDILAGSIFDILSNKKATGGTVYREHDNIGSQVADIGNHLRKAIQPGIAANMERTYKAINGDVTKTGKTYDMSDEAFAWFGWRVSTLDPKVALFYRSFDFKDAKSQAEKHVRDALSEPKDVSDDSLRDSYGLTVRLRDQAYTDMGRLVSAATDSGMSRSEIVGVLKNSGVSGQDIMALMSGRVPKYKPTPQVAQNIAARARNTFGPEAAKQVMERYRSVRSYTSP